MEKRIFGIFTAMTMIVLMGCHRNAPSVSEAKDSTEIKKIEAMQKRGSACRNNSDFEKAIATHDSCIQMAQDIKDTVQWVITLNNQGTNYRRLGANKEAADYHYQALQLCDAYSDTTTFHAKKNRVRSLNGLGNVMLTLGNYEAAEDFFRKALAGETKLNSATGQAINLANIGAIKEEHGELDSARIYYTLSMEKNREDSNSIGISLCYTYFGGLDKKAGKMKEALSNFRQAYSVGCTTGDIWHKLTPCLSLAGLYTDQNAMDSASHYINIGIKEAAEIHSNEFLRDFYSIRSLFEEKQGKVAQALADLRLCTAYGDSVLTEEERTNVQNARANYEAGRRVIEVGTANAEAESSRIIRNAVIVTALLLITILLYAFWMYRRYVRLRQKAEEERSTFVRNVAHMVRNPLTAVNGLLGQLVVHIPEDDAQGKEKFRVIMQESEKLMTAVSQLTDIDKSYAESLTDKNADIAPSAEPVRPLGHIAPLTDKVQESKATILMAEDDPNVAFTIRGIMEKEGYRVIEASDGRQALDILQQSELPDLLVTDVAMPRMNGLELIRQVREDETMCHLPIITVTARVEDKDRMEGINAGAEVYITKPFDPEELLLRIRTLLEQRERLRRYFSRLVGETDGAVAKEESAELDTLVFSDKEQDFLGQINGYIDANISTTGLTVDSIASHLCISSSTVNRKVKNITGMSCSEYISSRRIEYIKQMLLTHASLTISEVARRCGFEEQSTFSRFFKSHTGQTPGDFRKTQGK